GEQDAAIVAATMMYEAEELGVHSVWLRGFDSQEVAETFGLPESHIPVMMFAMGYPSDIANPSSWHFHRKPVEETVKIL
ncbi:MAG: nitroreductase family protein, partial [Lachnospiraceae bacterium]|nr:nitroreductase family protein [Lachnospiraceae bacterium]